MRKATIEDRDRHGTRTEYGMIMTELRNARTEREQREAMAALDEFHARSGTRGRVLPVYDRPVSRYSSPAATPARSGGGSLVGEFGRILDGIRSLNAEVQRVREAARRGRPGATQRGDLAALDAVLAGPVRRSAPDDDDDDFDDEDGDPFTYFID